MYTTLSRHSVNVPDLYRWGARIGSTVIMVSWLALFILDFGRRANEMPSPNSYGQGAAIAFIFAGYVIGWWKEAIGGVMAILGTVALFVVVALTLDRPLDSGAILFAAPGLFYLMADSYRDRRHEQVNR